MPPSTKKTIELSAQLLALRQISEQISGNWDLQDVLGKTVEIIHGYLRTDSCFIYLIKGEQLVLAASLLPHRRELGKVVMAVGEGLTGWVAKHKQSVVLSAAAYADPRFKVFSNLPEDKFEAFLSLPITAQGKVVGVMNLQNKRKTRFPARRVEFLETVARYIGTAVDNARLIGETQVLKQALETRKAVDRAKGLLMKKHGMSEPEAHAFLNKKSMDTRKSLQEVAEAVLLAGEIGG